MDKALPSVHPPPTPSKYIDIEPGIPTPLVVIVFPVVVDLNLHVDPEDIVAAKFVAGRVIDP
jgi:hypothetical protein